MNIKYMVVKTEILQKIAGCFASLDEFNEFTSNLQALIKELQFGNQLIERHLDNVDVITVSLLKQIFLFGVFCRQNMDVVKEIVNYVDFEEISKEQSERMRKDFGDTIV